MSTATAAAYSVVNHCSSSYMGGQQVGMRCVVGESSPSPTHGEGLDPSSPNRGDYISDLPPKSSLQTSSTMDSGVEDCCAEGGNGTNNNGGGAPTPTPTCSSTTAMGGPSSSMTPGAGPPVPSIELDEKTGRRVNVKMVKGDGCGYGFSVVWVSPPR